MSPFRVEMAPMQGVIDGVFRSVYPSHFSGVERTYSPFLRLRSGALQRRDERELAAGSREEALFTPQIMASRPEEADALCAILVERGFRRVNLNLGCPYPMQVTRGRGAGLLPHPERVARLLDVLCHREPALEVSVKTRLGLEAPDELAALVPVFNRFPLETVIVHPRTARQMYQGRVHWDVFGELARRLEAPTIANGDILTAEDAWRLMEDFPWISGVMLGRGLLRDPFLPADINGLELSDDRRATLRRFLDDLAVSYDRAGLSSNQVLGKLRDLWVFLLPGFPDHHRLARKLRKLRGMDEYHELMDILF